MDHLPSATSLSRALLTLARSGATGVLHVTATRVEQGPSQARLSIVSGTPRAIALSEPDENSLGDLLHDAGAFSGVGVNLSVMGADGDGLGGRADPRPVGEQLVASGVVTQEAVDAALHLQLRRRLTRLFSWRDPDYRFRMGGTDVGVPMLERPVPVGELVMGVMRNAVDRIEPADIRRRLKAESWELTPLGLQLLDDIELTSAELPMVALLRGGITDVDALFSAASGNLGAMRTLYALWLVRGLAHRGPEAYGLLLRKHRQVKRGERPRALLDLPPTAPATQGRAALRRLARSLHPDRFEGTSSGTVKRMSNDVLSALVGAEATLRRERRGSA